MLIVALSACQTPDPQIDAWAGAIQVDTVAQALTSCDDPPVPFDPPRKYAFVAMDRGLPDLATFYWCHATDNCDEFVASVGLAELTKDHFAGDQFTTTSAGGNLCTVAWTQLEGDQSGKDVTLTVHTGLSETDGVTEDQCPSLGADSIGLDCTGVLVVTGTRVE